jgi:selenocysteine lyase/cysteine desulfurase
VGLANGLRDRVGLPAGDSAIVTVPAAGALERLRAAGIRSATRAGATRLSFHVHNTVGDVDVVARALGH